MRARVAAFFRVTLWRRRGGAVRRAAQHAVDLVVVPAAAAGRVGNSEGRRRAHAQFEGFLVEAGLVGEFQPDDRELAVGDGLAKFYDIALLGRALASLERQNVEIA